MELSRQRDAAAPDADVVRDLPVELLWDFAAVALCLVQVDGTIVRTNPAFDRLVGAADAALAGFDLSELIHPDERDHHRNLRAEIARSGRRSAGTDRRVLRFDGATRTVRVSSLPVAVAGHSDPVLLLQFDDTELREARAALEYAARHDALTGLPNRAVILGRLEDELTRRLPGSGRPALLFCDLDGFKRLNDDHGHAFGDEVLVEVARRLSDAVRPQDTVARIGGDEFLVLARGLDTPDAGALLAARLADAIAQPCRLRSVDLELRVSIGLAVSTDDDTEPAALIEAADADMYRDKRDRRLRTIVLPAEQEAASPSAQ